MTISSEAINMGREKEPTTPFSSISTAPEKDARYSDFPFSWGEVDSMFNLARLYPASYFRRLEEVREKAREFSTRYIRPCRSFFCALGWGIGSFKFQ
jgi:hypothetical protein